MWFSLVLNTLIILGVLWFWKYMDKLVHKRVITENSTVDEDLPLEMVDELGLVEYAQEDIKLQRETLQADGDCELYVAVVNMYDKILALSAEPVELTPSIKLGMPVLRCSDIEMENIQSGTATHFYFVVNTPEGYYPWCGPHLLSLTKPFQMNDTVIIHEVTIKMDFH